MKFFTFEKIEKLLIDIKGAIHRETIDIRRFKYKESDYPFECSRCQSAEFDDHDWSDFQVGDFWGGYDKIAWFRTRLSIPYGWQNKKLHLRFQVGPREDGKSTAEALLYVNGKPLQAMDAWHEEAWLPPDTLAKDQIDIALKAWSGVLGVPARRTFRLAQLIWIDRDAEHLYFLTNTLLKTIQLMDENSLSRLSILQAIDQAYLLVDFKKPGSERFYETIGNAAQFLDALLEEWQSLDELKPTVVGIGHAHIDMAWLWRLSHSRDKAVRSFTTALHLMHQFPNYRFMHSSPQLYKFLKEDDQEIYERVKDKIANGEWEITGATWVEPDTNIPSGESLVRQFLFGKRYVRKEFGIDMKLLWLPDVFGYSATLPQIIRKSGVEYFMTTKISWSQFNRFPYDTFLWRGLDGTEVLTHFVTTPEENSWFYTYNGQMRPEDVRGIWDAYQQKDVNDELLLIFGWGDGGGGPDQEMLERATIQKNLPGHPRVELGKAEPYFERLSKRLEGKDLPVWDGELYLEYHRGTYTSQASTKRANRKAEFLYHNAEWLSSLADLLTCQQAYPAEKLEVGWELILLNQFHDILPGSSIRQVYEDSARDFQHVNEIGEQVIMQAIDMMVPRIAEEQDSLVVFNPLAWVRDDLLEMPLTESLIGKTILFGDSRARYQLLDVPDGQRLLIEVNSVPSLGYHSYPLIPSEPQAQSTLVVSPDHLENDFYSIQLDENGKITLLYDKRHNRQVLDTGQVGNVLQAFEDKPLRFDAWDIDIYYQEKMTEITDLQEAVIEETGPLRGTLRLMWKFQDSKIIQRLSIYDRLPRIDFRTEVDWHEKQVLLKVAFPVNVRSTRATYDIQFGNLQRPTHWNTSWDWARFEVSGQKWADLSEGNYGVALLNDCKYGHDIHNNVMRLTLIKSAIEPDAMADKGHHEFTYSLLPHAGDWREGNVALEGYALNQPLLFRLISANPTNRSLPTRFQFASLDVDHIILETVKHAEDGEAWIVRLYEYKQFRSEQVHLTFGLPIRKAVECNLMEENETAVDFAENWISFSIKPYEIKTFKVWFQEIKI